jgi:hypothetical protein
MDLALYAQIVRRRWRLFAGGLVAAVLLALLAYVSVGPGGIRYREQESWQSDATIFVTQTGFPWGRAYEQYLSGDPAKNLPPVPLGDNSRLSYLAMLYAQLANGDAVQNRIFHGKRDSSRSLIASAVVPTNAPSGTVLPLLQLRATAPTKGQAATLANRATTAFTNYLVRQQQEAGIGKGERVVTQVLNSGTVAVRVSGRGKTVPILVFLAVMVGVFGLGFVLENVRTKSEEAPAPDAELEPPTAVAVAGGVTVRDRLRARALADSQTAEDDEGPDAPAGGPARTTTRTRTPARARSRTSTRSSGNGASGSHDAESLAGQILDPATAGEDGSKVSSGTPARTAARPRRAAQPRSGTTSRSATKGSKPVEVSDSEDGQASAAADSGEAAVVAPERPGPRVLVEDAAAGDDGSAAPPARARAATRTRAPARPRSRTTSRSSAADPEIRSEDALKPPFLGPAGAAEAAGSKAPAGGRGRPATRTRKASQPRSRPAGRAASTKAKPVAAAVSEDEQAPEATAPVEGVVPEPSLSPVVEVEAKRGEDQVEAVGSENAAEVSPADQPAEADDAGRASIGEEGQLPAGDETGEEQGTGTASEAGEDAGPSVAGDSNLGAEPSSQTDQLAPQRPH